MSFDRRPFPPGLLSHLTNLVRETFVRTGELPPVGIDGWRACLLEAWRSRWSWLQEEAAYGDRRHPRSWERSEPENAALLRAAVNAIHTEIWQEEQWWWAPNETPTEGDRWERAVCRSEESYGERRVYGLAFDCLGEMIEAVETRKLTVIGALMENDGSSDPVTRYRRLCGRQLALGLITQAHRGQVGDPSLGALYTARADAWYGTLGLTYEEFGAPPVLDVVGASEASEVLGVELGRIARWRKDGTLPLPYADLAMSPVWVRSDIERIRDGFDVITCTEPPQPTVLLGTAEAASVLGVDKSQIARWRRSASPRRGPAFPEPAKTIKAGPIWRRTDLMKFGFARDDRNARAWTPRS